MNGEDGEGKKKKKGKSELQFLNRGRSDEKKGKTLCNAGGPLLCSHSFFFFSNIHMYINTHIYIYIYLCSFYLAETSFIYIYIYIYWERGYIHARVSPLKSLYEPP